MKIASYHETKAEPARIEGATGLSIRGLIGPEAGADKFTMFGLRLQAGGSTPCHAHAWEEALLVLKGSGEIRGEGGTQPLGEGVAVCTPPGVTHQYVNTGDGELEMLCVMPLGEQRRAREPSSLPIKCVHYTGVPEEPVTDPGVKGVHIRILVGPDDGAGSFVMRRFRVRPGGYTPLHTHDWEHEVFVLSGRGEIMTPRGPRPLGPGDAVFAEAGMEHQFRNTGEGGAEFEFICVIPAM
jgi:quercetin dioxygenase-like cupin family protein